MKSWGKKKSSKITTKNHRKLAPTPREETKKIPQKLVDDMSSLQKQVHMKKKTKVRRKLRHTKPHHKKSAWQKLVQRYTAL